MNNLWPILMFTDLAVLLEHILKTKSDRKSSNFRYYVDKSQYQNNKLSILQSFLHFLKAKYISNCLQ